MSSVCSVRPKVLMRKGKQKPQRPKLASGFDYPATPVGTSTWLGSDGQPVAVFYDPSTGAPGFAVAKYVLSTIDDLMSSCDVWFGFKGMGGNVIICPDFGGAYHYGCDFPNGGTWYESLDSGGQDTVLGLVMAEVCESYMGSASANQFNCGGSGGEGLSRFLAEVASGGASGAMSAYSAGPSWDGSDWIGRDQGTDQDYPSIGCSVLYMWWMTSQGFSVAEIVQAGEPDGTLASNYAKLTGKAASAAFVNFNSAVAAVGGPGGFSNDNPFSAPDPTYPATNGPSPPPPPPPPPPGGGTFAATGTLDFFGQSLPLTLSGTDSAAGGPKRSVNWLAVFADLAKLASDASSGQWALVANDFAQLLVDLGSVPTPEGAEYLVANVKIALRAAHERTATKKD